MGSALNFLYFLGLVFSCFIVPFYRFLLLFPEPAEICYWGAFPILGFGVSVREGLVYWRVRACSRFCCVFVAQFREK